MRNNREFRQKASEKVIDRINKCAFLAYFTFEYASPKTKGTIFKTLKIK